jgi:hypothetical protein
MVPLRRSSTAERMIVTRKAGPTKISEASKGRKRLRASTPVSSYLLYQWNQMNWWKLLWLATGSEYSRSTLEGI